LFWLLSDGFWWQCSYTNTVHVASYDKHWTLAARTRSAAAAVAAATAALSSAVCTLLKLNIELHASTPMS
jgi:hypothetical protein